jgi:hypothetical protein
VDPPSVRQACTHPVPIGAASWLTSNTKPRVCRAFFMPGEGLEPPTRGLCWRVAAHFGGKSSRLGQVSTAGSGHLCRVGNTVWGP